MDAQDSGSRSTAARAFPNSRGLIDELKARCQAHHEHLVSLASYAEALVEACREEARLEARTIVMNARERADALVAESRERADEVLVAARQEADGLRAEAKRLSGAISIAAREQADTTLSDAKTEAESLVADARTRADAILAAAAPLVTAFPSLTAPEPQPLELPPQVTPTITEILAAIPTHTEFIQESEPPPDPHTITFLPDMGYERTVEGTEADEARGAYAPMSLLEQDQSVPELLDGEVVNRRERRGKSGFLVAVGTAVVLVGGAAAFYVSWPTRRSAVSDVRRAGDEVAPAPIDRAALASSPATPLGTTTPAPSATSASAAAVPSAAAMTPEPLSVTVSARRRAWVRLGTDGKSGTSGFLQPGDNRVLTATREVNIHSGDAGALLVSVNGAPAAPFGKDGSVVTRRLTADSDAAPPAPAAALATRAAAVPAPAAGTDAGRNPPKAAPSGSALTAAAPPPAAAKSASSAPAVPPAAIPLPATPPARLADATGGSDPAQGVRTPATTRDATGAAAVATTGRSETAVVDPPGAKLTRADLLQAEHGWFDAHYRGDHSAMGRFAAHEFELKDDRTFRPTPGLVSMERTVRNLAVDIWGGGALVTGSMTERPKAGTGTDAAVESSFVETWIQRDGRWQMLGLRLLPPQSAPR
jgi:F0F1-type ATP synthase membrane subunit b/b'